MFSILSFFDYSLYKKFIIKGSGLLFLILIIIIWSVILIWVLCNQAHISTIESDQSTLTLRIKEPIITKYTEKDFDTNYVDPKEFDSYNRVWDSEDYSFPFTDEIQVITNLIITPNQTQSVCPESPLIAGAICDPDSNHCKLGRKIKHGIETGRCITGDFKYFNETKHWLFGTDCEVKGWCPVERLWPPLKGFSAVLKDTQDSHLWLKNTIYIPEYDIVLDNQPNPHIKYYLHCEYNPKTDPLCPIMKLKDIVELSRNNNQSYEMMARFGAVINVNIVWKCFYPLLRSFNQTKDCLLEYSFERIDNEKTIPTTGYTSFRKAFLYDGGRTRTHWRTYRLRLAFTARAVISRYDFYHFLTNYFAYFGFYSMCLTLLAIIMRRCLKNKIDHVDEYFEMRSLWPLWSFKNSEQADEARPLLQDHLNAEESLIESTDQRSKSSQNSIEITEMV